MMKIFLSVAVSAVILPFSTQAHEMEHSATGAESPDCSAVQTMDHSKMDMSDPVMKALMQKCMNNSHHEHGMANHEEQMDHMNHSGHMSHMQSSVEQDGHDMPAQTDHDQESHTHD